MSAQNMVQATTRLKNIAMISMIINTSCFLLPQIRSCFPKEAYNQTKNDTMPRHKMVYRLNIYVLPRHQTHLIFMLVFGRMLLSTAAGPVIDDVVSVFDVHGIQTSVFVHAVTIVRRISNKTRAKRFLKT